MITEPELLNERLERLAMVLDEIMPNCASLVRDALKLLKEQEADIIAMSRFLESHGWDSDSICGKNVEIVVTNGDDDDD